MFSRRSESLRDLTLRELLVSISSTLGELDVTLKN